MKRWFVASAMVALLASACGQGGDVAPPATGPSAPAAGSPAGTPAATGPLTAPTPTPGGPAATGPAATGPVAATLSLDSIVAPTVELNLREEPGTASNRLGTIAAGSQSFLVDGPREADGYSWYLVSGVGLPPASGCAGTLETEPYNCPMWFGWVASASPEGDPWLVPDDAGCPTEAPYEAEDYNASKPPLLLLHCYGADTLRLRAWLPEQEAPPCPGQDAVPWLACPGVTLGWSQDYPSGLYAAIDPSSGLALPASNQWVEITGHMDHPRSVDCRPFPEQPAAQAPVFCRAILVLDSIAPTAGP